jgi:hypothetical protein
MSRCARCDTTCRENPWCQCGCDDYAPGTTCAVCGLFTARDPWWIRTLARIRRGRL